MRQSPILPLIRSLTLAVALSVSLTVPARADFPEMITGQILPGLAGFATATQALADAAQTTCDVAVLQPAYQTAFDAWMAVQHIHLGPVEEDGRGLAIAFWPDPKGTGIKAQRALLTGDPAKLAAVAFAEQSVAARGLMGLERLLFPAEPLPADPCPLTRATATDLARLAAEVQAGWADGFAQALLTAGQPGNTQYLSQAEARQALFTQIATGLEDIKDKRLARPMGAADSPTPDRAEARASGRSQRNVLLALQALRYSAAQLSSTAPRTIAAFDHAIGLAQRLDDPVFAGTATPGGRLKLEILQQAVSRASEVMLEELAPQLQVGIGFNAGDGD